MVWGIAVDANVLPGAIGVVALVALKPEADLGASVLASAFATFALGLLALAFALVVLTLALAPLLAFLELVSWGHPRIHGMGLAGQGWGGDLWMNRKVAHRLPWRQRPRHGG